MWPYLSSTSGDTFSSCSVASIAETMAKNNCHVEASDLALSLNKIDANSASFNVTNLDSRIINREATLTVSGPGAGSASANGLSCSQVNADKISCYVASVTQTNPQQVDLQFSSPLSDSALLTATLEPIAVIDVNTHNNNLETDIHGDFTLYAGSINSDPVTHAASGDYASSSSNKSIASAEGAGPLHPSYLLLLWFAVIAKRRQLFI